MCGTTLDLPVVFVVLVPAVELVAVEVGEPASDVEVPEEAAPASGGPAGGAAPAGGTIGGAMPGGNQILPNISEIKYVTT